MKVWITKYALTKGIYEAEVADAEPGETMVVQKTGYGFNYFHRNDWHRTEEEAKKRADEMRVAKLASLRKQVNKLERMKF